VKNFTESIVNSEIKNTPVPKKEDGVTPKKLLFSETDKEISFELTKSRERTNKRSAIESIRKINTDD
jgi:hypothetical protein